MFEAKEIEYIKEFIEERPDAFIYIGADSQRQKKKRVKYAIVVIVHFIDENGVGKGAKVFADVSYEKQPQEDLSRPYQRMMREVAMITELYEQLEDTLMMREFEIHIDVNPKKGTGSNVAFDAAKWTIFGSTGVEPICKPLNEGDPYPFAASCAADKYSK